MTAISLIANSTSCMFISDILVSRTGATAKTARLPVSGLQHEAALRGSGRAVAGSTQKTAILRPNICIAVAGDAPAAIRLVRYLDDNLDSGTVSIAHLREVIGDYPSYKLSGVEYLLACIHGGKRHIQGSRPYIDHKTCLYATAGTGCCELDRLIRLAIDEVGESTSPYLALILTGLSVIGSASIQELALGHSLREYWGGGYEMTIWNGEEFVKYGDFATIILNFNLIGDDELDVVLLPTYYYQTYRDGDLVIAVDDGLGVMEIHVIGPMLGGTFNRHEIGIMEPKGVVALIKTIDPNGDTNLGSVVFAFPEEDVGHNLSITASNERTSLRVSDYLVDEILKLEPNRTLRAFLLDGWEDSPE